MIRRGWIIFAVVLAVALSVAFAPARLERRVFGTVRLSDGSPAEGYRVRAYDDDLPGDDNDELMQETLVNAAGEYTMQYRTGRWDGPREPAPRPPGTWWRPDIYVVVAKPQPGGGWKRVYQSDVEQDWEVRTDVRWDVRLSDASECPFPGKFGTTGVWRGCSCPEGTRKDYVDPLKYEARCEQRPVASVGPAREPGAEPIQTDPGGRVVIPTPCPVCDRDKRDYWNAAKTDLLVLADSHRMNIGGKPTQKEVPAVSDFLDRLDVLDALKPVMVDNWVPLDTLKQTLCGEVKDFGSYNGAGPEYDANIFIKPRSDHEFFFYEALAQQPLLTHTYGTLGLPGNPALMGYERYSWDETMQHCDDGPCIEAEIDPDRSLQRNEIFDLDLKTAEFKGKYACVYGPWVAELFHGARPEIHPSEAIWWQPATNQLYVAFFQDDSDRFHYWAGAPRAFQGWIPFEVDSAPGSPLVFTVEERFQLNMNRTSTDDVSANDGLVHELTYRNRVLVRVEERNPDTHLGVTFSANYCMEAGKIRGYVKFWNSIGVDNEGKEGAQGLLFSWALAEPVQAVAQAAPARVVQRRIPLTRRFSIPPRPGVRTAVLGEIRLGDKGAAATSTVSPVGPGAAAPVSIPLDGGRVVVVGQAGDSAITTIAPVALSLLMGEPRTRGWSPSPADWSAIVQSDSAVRAVFDTSAQWQLSRAAGWLIPVGAYYTGSRDGRAAWEDRHAIGEALTKAAHGPAQERQRVFGDSIPVDFTYSVVVEPLTGGVADTLTDTRTASRMGMEARLHRVGPAAAVIEVSLPATVPPARVVVRVDAKDKLGRAATAGRLVDTHGFVERRSFGMAGQAATRRLFEQRLLDRMERRPRAGVMPASRLLQVAGPDKMPPRRLSPPNRIQLSRLALQRSTKDNVITLSEFRSLIAQPQRR